MATEREHNSESEPREARESPRISSTSIGRSDEPGRTLAGWEQFPHDADIGIRGWGRTVAEAFEQAARAMTSAVTEARIEPRSAVTVQCEAPELELLFVEWLNAVIYEMAVRDMIFAEFVVRIDGCELRGTLEGEPLDVQRHAPVCEPKGATYTALEVAQSPDGLWSAACVIDV